MTVPPYIAVAQPREYDSISLRDEFQRIQNAMRDMQATLDELEARPAVVETGVPGPEPASPWSFEKLLELPVWLPEDLRFQLELARDNSE